MSQIIKIPLMKDHQDKPGYQSFIHDLNQIFNLQSLDPSNLKWVECEGPPSYNLTQPPNTFLDIGGNSPHININLYPMHDRNKVTGGTIYQAPLLMRDVSRWKYQI